MSVDYRFIGSRIAGKRKEHKKTQAQLAELLDVSVGYISQLERGITKINLDTLSKIGDVLHTDIAWFVSGSVTDGTSDVNGDFFRLYERLTAGNKRVIRQLSRILLEDQ